MAVRRHKEAIHSADEQDEDDIAIPIPSEDSTAEKVPNAVVQEKVQNQFKSLVNLLNTSAVPNLNFQHSQTTNSLMIDVSLTKLFQCMSIAYRQKLTSPKWNRFLGMKLRWKDKFRLNNVIWRCWHMQFIKGHRKLVCAFANPMELDNHNKTEAGALLEGKYWKRKMDIILAEYKKWRVFYKHQHNWPPRRDRASISDNHTIETAGRIGKDDIELESLITDHDFFVDALFNSLGSQSVQFNDHTHSSDQYMQPNLHQLQPNLEDLMDLDPMAPLQDWLSSKLPEGVDESMSMSMSQLQNIKDIEVEAAAYHHQSQNPKLKAFNKSSGGKNIESQNSSSNSSTGKNIQNIVEYSAMDSQPSTSTFSSYAEYNHKKVPLPGKKMWAIQQQQQMLQQQQQQEQQQQQQQQQQEHQWVGERKPELNSCRIQSHVPHHVSQSSNNVSGHVSVIQTQNSQNFENSQRMGGGTRQQRSVIAHASLYKNEFKTDPPTNTSLYKEPVTNSTSSIYKESNNSSSSYILPSRVPAQVSPPHIKHEVHDKQGSSELVQLLQVNKSKPDLHLRQRQNRKHKHQVSVEIQSNISGKHKKVVSIPPPPASGLPQPSLNLGSSQSDASEETKVSTAELKRKCSIKNGFEYLRALIPSLAQTPNVKISKAALLAKGADHVKLLSKEKEALSREVEQLRNSVNDLNSDISCFQLQLPTAGSAKGRTGSGDSVQLQSLFDSHVATCTMQNWKYFVFSKLMQPLLVSYDRTVSSTSNDDLARTSGSWLDQHVSLVQLRPLVMNSLKELSVSTDILSEPHRMPQEALNHVQNIIAPKKEYSTRKEEKEENKVLYYDYE